MPPPLPAPALLAPSLPPLADAPSLPLPLLPAVDLPLLAAPAHHSLFCQGYRLASCLIACTQ